MHRSIEALNVLEKSRAYAAVDCRKVTSVVRVNSIKLYYLTIVKPIHLLVLFAECVSSGLLVVNLSSQLNVDVRILSRLLVDSLKANPCCEDVVVLVVELSLNFLSRNCPLPCVVGVTRSVTFIHYSTQSVLIIFLLTLLLIVSELSHCAVSEQIRSILMIECLLSHVKILSKHKVVELIPSSSEHVVGIARIELCLLF